MRLKVKKLHPNAQLPRYATTGSACFDLHALIDDEDHQQKPPAKVLPFGKGTSIRTGLAFEIPQGYAMLIFSRSGHGFRNGVRLTNCVGVIDSDYRGEVMVQLICDRKTGGLEVKHGDRVAQGMLIQLPWFAVDVVEELSGTERGDGGFGSTGS